MNTKLMAIINVSPDSFSGDGVAQEAALVSRICSAAEAGADILDIGGQSTRPGAVEISESEEMQRVLPAVDAARRLTSLPISIDTYRPSVAAACLSHGASIINDVRGLGSLEMQRIALRSGATVIVMHSRGTPATMKSLTYYPGDIVEALSGFFRDRIRQLTEMGIDPAKIFIDPGIGFAKTTLQSLILTKSLASLVGLGYPVVYGASRKSFLGDVVQAAGRSVPPAQRDAATTATSILAMVAGVSILRIHDVDSAFQARAVYDSVFFSNGNLRREDVTYD